MRPLTLALTLLGVLALAAAATPQDVDSPLPDFQAAVDAQDSAALEIESAAFRGAIEQLIEDRELLDEQIAAAAEGEAAEQQTQRDAVQVQIDVLAERMGYVVNRLDELGVDVADEQVFLTQVTGVIDVTNLSADAAVSLVSGWIEDGKDFVVNRGPGLVANIAIFLVILIIFKFLAGMAGKVTNKALRTSKLKPSELLASFTVNIVKKLIFVVGLLVALPYIGIETGPFLAGVGVAGFVIGFALQDTLANFAAGIMILLYRPYDVGDVVSAGGVTGKVQAMSLVSTTYHTPDNQKVVVPNGSIWGGTITNITANPTRRVDMVVGVGYGDDLDKAQSVLMEELKKHPKVLEDPEPVVECSNLGESSVDFVVRPWCRTGDYWDVHFDLTKSIKQRLDAEGLNIPFPQRDIHVFNA